MPGEKSNEERSGLRVRSARSADVSRLAPKLRQADREEIRAATGEAPGEVLERGFYCSDPCYSIVDGCDEPLALFGVVPKDGGAGIVWLLGSDELLAYPVAFSRLSRSWIDRLHERYSVLWNRVDARNQVHVRWLQWCGFTIHRTIAAFGVECRPFHEFSRGRDGACPTRVAEMT